MARRFTVIQGGLSQASGQDRPGGRTLNALPGRARLEAVGAALRRRLAALPRPGVAPALRGHPQPVAAGPVRRPIPTGAFLGVRPEGWSQDAA
ncbi:hypothetical protein [Methylobacterium sp. J-076]|uniref:hypothetical protein n=1 Tax=Methylobacterium sp. J-076 TaxID=2836655 RepID=UPI001FB8A148|nr:hypothetical protein [Methylobacterium sp. J-076]MCJ2012884.1 hypothetical protein [Methylobacterium sp. J-076]